MEGQIVKLIEEAWLGNLDVLKKRVGEISLKLENLVVIEDHYRHGYKESGQLQKSLGNFAENLIDGDSMSSVLVHGERKLFLSPERLERVQRTLQLLSDWSRSAQTSPPECEVISIEEDLAEITAKFEKHQGAMAELFRAMRIAKLEIDARYDPEVHDPFFEKFDWCLLDNAETALCPPFVVFAKRKRYDSEFFTKLLNLLCSGIPIKVVVLRSDLDRLYQFGSAHGRAAVLRSSIDVELLPVLLRKIYFLQSSSIHTEQFRKYLQHGLSSPRPAVFSIYSPDSADKLAAKRQVKLALLSRAFAHLSYDPERAADFVSSFNMLGNPQPDSLWASSVLEYLSEAGITKQIERPVVFADFLLQMGEAEERFKPLPYDIREDKALPLADFLQMTTKERSDKTPFIYATDQQGHLIRLVPSYEIILQSAEKMHLWQTLQALVGIHNPYVKKAEQEAREKMQVERERDLSELRQQMEDKIKSREKEAVAGAMRNLAQALTGMTSQIQAAGEAEIGQPQAEAASASEQSAASDLPWIDSNDCISCGECIALNDRIFSYNNDKKAFIKNPRGGRYKDIVKAAEKCPALVIHPGKPLDPEEPDLESLIKRAEPYQ